MNLAVTCVPLGYGNWVASLPQTRSSCESDKMKLQQSDKKR
jgi:hypothetical protein